MLAAGLLAACSGGTNILLPGNGVPSHIEVVEGDGQSGRVGETLAKPVVVEVTDSRGRPVEGASVAFEFTSAAPGAGIVPGTASTDAKGQAGAQVVLGTTVGLQTGEARVVTDEADGAPKASFTVTALSENANGIAAVSGDDQRGRAGSTLAAPLVVEVTDAFGNPISGVSTNWTAEGGGSVSDATMITDASGRASVQRTLGPAAGRQTALASAEGLAGSPVTFIHTATAGDASELLIVSGNDQTAAVGTRLPADLVVRLVDGAGNGVPGAAVTWLVGAGDGTVTPENGTTDEAGRSSAQWTLGPNPVDNRVDAVVSGVGIVNFRATATAGTPAALSIRTQPSSSARNGVPLQRQPVVQIRDNQGNEVATPGVQVTAQLSGGGGELIGTRVIGTDAQGRATFTDLAISGAAGRRTIAFTASGYAGVASNEIEVRPIATLTTITSDLPDPSVAGTTFTVAFQVTSGGPTPTGSVTVTVSGGTPNCTGTLQSGAGSCQLTLNIVGVRTLTATYSGAAGLERSSGTARHEVTAVAPQNRVPTADYDWHCDGFTCQFTDTSKDPDGQVTGWTWNFGDGSPTSGVKDPTHTYSGPGDYTVTLTAMDNGGATDLKSAPVRVNAPPPNQAPQADFDLSCTDLTCTFTDKSKDDDGVIVSRSWNYGDGTPASSVPSHTYASEGKYQVTLTVTDDDGASSSKTRDANPKAPPPPPNTPPTAANDVATTDEDVSITIAVVANDNDPDGDVLTPQIATQPQDGTATVNGDRSITYTPNSNFSGNDGFSYRVSDGRGGVSNLANVQITVTPVNDAPVAQDDGPYATPGGDQPLTVSAGAGVLANDSDPDGPTLTAQSPSAPSQGTVALSADGSFTYTPNAGATGTDSFTYQASDGDLTSSPATVTITINP